MIVNLLNILAPSTEKLHVLTASFLPSFFVLPLPSFLFYVTSSFLPFFLPFSYRNYFMVITRLSTRQWHDVTNFSFSLPQWHYGFPQLDITGNCHVFNYSRHNDREGTSRVHKRPRRCKSLNCEPRLPRCCAMNTRCRSAFSRRWHTPAIALA